jgi:hypothetical protein
MRTEMCKRRHKLIDKRAANYARDSPIFPTATQLLRHRAADRSRFRHALALKPEENAGCENVSRRNNGAQRGGGGWKLVEDKLTHGVARFPRRSVAIRVDPTE